MDFKQINSGLLPQLEIFCRTWFPAGKKSGNEYKIGGLDGSKGESLSINLKSGVWKDFATGDGGSDVISLYAAFKGISQSKAAKLLSGVSVEPPPKSNEISWGPLTEVPDEDQLPKPPLIEGWTHYVYRKPDGQIYGFVQRSPDKRIVPLSWCISDEGETAWRQKAFAKPRPLYGLETLKRARTVVVVEGEKAADALRAICPVPVLTWPGGSNAVAHADWTPLENRRVIVWPDNDEAGRKAAAAIVERLPNAEILKIPPDKPEGWDAADWTDGDVVPFLRLDTPAPIALVAVSPELVAIERGETGSEAWEEYGIRQTARGVPVPNLAAVYKILNQHPFWAGRIWWDEFLERIQFKPETGSEPREWADNHERQALLWLQSVFELYNAGIGEVRDAVRLIAERNRKNELVDWLRGLVWDQTPRVRELFTTGFGAEPNDYVSDVGQYWLTSAVARALRPGCKVDTLPILEGSQGAGKSSGLRVLGGRWFTEIHADVREKDFFVVLNGKWILELSEMHSLGKAEVARVKGVLSNQVDRYRIPYEAHASDHPRRSVFAGTTNRDDWQCDTTGARRFWPIRCGSVDLEWLSENREQLFAEAVTLFDSGSRWWGIDSSAETKLREPSDTWAEILVARLEEGSLYSSAEIMSRILDIPVRDQDQPKQRRLAEVLRTLGWRSLVTRRSGTVLRLWSM